MTTFTFPYRRQESEDGTIVYRPWARIYLPDEKGVWTLFEVIADAGADLTLLRQEDCEALGYELKAGTPLFMRGVCSGITRVHVHQLPLRLGTEVFPCPVAFAEQAPVPRLLGRRGVFERFKVCYDDVTRVTEFMLREDPAALQVK